MKKMNQGLTAFAFVAATTAVIAGCSSKDVKSEAANEPTTTSAAALTDWDANAAAPAAPVAVNDDADTTASGATSDPVDLGSATPGRSR